MGNFCRCQIFMKMLHFSLQKIYLRGFYFCASLNWGNWPCICTSCLSGLYVSRKFHRLGRQLNFLRHGHSSPQSRYPCRQGGLSPSLEQKMMKICKQKFPTTECKRRLTHPPWLTFSDGRPFTSLQLAMTEIVEQHTTLKVNIMQLSMSTIDTTGTIWTQWTP